MEKEKEPLVSDSAQKKELEICPEEKANIISRLLYWWMNPLFWKGVKQPLEKQDLWLLSSRFHSQGLADQFEELWKTEVEEFKKNNEGKISPEVPASEPAMPSSAKVLSKMFFWKLMPAGIYKFISDIANVASPLLLTIIITYVSSTTPQPLWLGFVWIIVLFLLNFISSLLTNWYFMHTSTVGLAVRTVLSTVIYRKSLRLSAASRQEFSAGKIMNIVSTDCARIESFIMYIHVLWTSPLQIIMICGLLIWQLGVSAIAGLGLMFLMTPVQGWLYKKLSVIRKTVAPIADKRVKTTQEVLQGIRVIKFFAWEEPFLKKIEELRSLEIKQVLTRSLLNAFVMAIVFAIPVLTASVAFVIYGVINPVQNPGVVFASLTWFGYIRFPLMFLPNVLVGLAEFKVAMKRITELLMAPEVDMKPELNLNSEYGVEIIDGEFKWDRTKEKSDLKNINFKAKKGQLVAVVGAVGSGKSCLLNAIVGEMCTVNGKIVHGGTIGYAPQQAWIQNASLEQNILFGREKDQNRYTSAIRDCALERDIQLFPDGDQTEIGERGINCSGGQKQRINLARCVYFDSEIVLMDDPLSAVDAHVGKYLFEHCIQGALKSKTRILVTHQLHFLPQVDYVVCMKNGEIAEQGTFDELMKKQGEFATLIKNFGGNGEKSEKAEAKSAQTDLKILQESLNTRQKPAQALMTAEERATGAVKANIWWKYMEAAGGWSFVIVLLLCVVFVQCTKIATDLWLVQWTGNTLPWLSVGAYVGIYLGLGVSQALASYINGVYYAFKGTRAGKVLHEKAIKRVLRAPVSFYDTTPLGRIINRFSKDQDGIDNSLMDAFRMFVNTLGMTVSTLVVIIYATWLFIVPLIPMLVIYYFIQWVYRNTSRELKRLDSISRSPLYAHFGETLTGLGTIRAYNEEHRFIKVTEKFTDETNSPYFLVLMAQRWLGIRLEFIGTVLVFFAALFGILAKTSISPALLGLSLSYALQVTGTLNWCVRQFVETEVAMNAVERVSYYANNIENEADAIIESNRPSKEWPSEGKVDFNQVEMRYSKDTPLILKKISFSVEAKEKIGIVGRTGAGKSSIMNALFRMIEPSGSINIDSVNIQSIGLYDLRSRLAIIPQDPMLFGASVRFNVDPLNEHSDQEIWNALEKANLKSKVSSMEGGLEAMIAEGGENLSVGQRQLLCLARAILKRPKILVMDEATANVDYETDSIIQKCMRLEFKDASILTIAHRLNTIIDYDRVLVLKEGEIAELDTPRNLILAQGVFYSMVQETGESNAKMLTELILKNN